ncbi:hypothetical protein DVH24_014393 [Malus domestica]|uniref:Cystatin domain-containing protein n=1 Tax=Malus domestica TaxID=3750 RepID=A0A498IRG7_MALDO|nr:hypothetical protein DVH24_014393 [Malus domestica]
MWDNGFQQKEIGNYAVTDHNKQLETKGQNELVFVSVEGGEFVMEDGIKYLLVISARNEMVAEC